MRANVRMPLALFLSVTERLRQIIYNNMAYWIMMAVVSVSQAENSLIEESSVFRYDPIE
jgi:hypothetical protein